MQLKHQKVRLAVAALGIAFAVVLILMQLGFRASLLDSTVRYLERYDYDIALINTETLTAATPKSFSLRRLQQARAVSGVDRVSAIYAATASWKNPYNHQPRNIFAVGVDPADGVLRAEGFAENIALVRRRDAVIFDALSRPEHGPVAERFRAGESVSAEVNQRRVEVVGLFEMGTSFAIDGSVITSEDNFLRLFPERQRTQVDIGLVKLVAGSDAKRVAAEMRGLVPDDVEVLTRAGFIDREKAHWLLTTPIGAVFTFGVIVGFFVGAIIVYQILFADVSDHLPEYATLKAMGYSNRFVSGVVIQQAVILSVLGFLPGALICMWLYRVVGDATHLPMQLGWERAVAVFALTVGMCSFSGMLALRKVRSLDPADVF
jgi:putative ABC transport system permease protein